MIDAVAHPPPPGPPRMVQLDACPVCGDGTGAFSFSSPDLFHGVPGDFSYDECRSCGSFFQNPRAVDADLTMYYPGNYFTHDGLAAHGLGSGCGRLQSVVRRLVLESRSRPRAGGIDLRGRCGRLLNAVGFLRRRAMFGLVDQLGPPTGADRCLEVGPGTGDDMWRLSRVGWAVTGIDLDPQAAEVASSRSGREVIVGSILDHRPREPYGLVYGSHSLEHVPDIRNIIAHVHSLLGSGGRLVLIIPNPRSLSARLYGPLSVVWDPPRHLSLPSVGALRDLLGETGFRTVEVTTTSRRAAHNFAVARGRRHGAGGTDAWNTRATRAEKLLQATESVLVRLGWPVGEEIIVSATAR